MEKSSKYQLRIYNISEVCSFRKTKEAFGGLSNMASGYPIKVNDINIFSSEALYQACRFPHMPDVQEKILLERSPMTAKMVSKPFRNNSRDDWEKVRVEVMFWCLRIKLAQNFYLFGRLLETTGDKAIVEESGRDDFWGAIHDKANPSILKGINALGRLLMKLREEYNSIKRYELLLVESLPIPQFLLLGKAIPTIDQRPSFVSEFIKCELSPPRVKTEHHFVDYVSNNVTTSTKKPLQLEKQIKNSKVNIKKKNTKPPPTLPFEE